MIDVWPAERIWRRIAWVARYGNQRVSDLRQMTNRDFSCLEEGIWRIIQAENAPRD